MGKGSGGCDERASLLNERAFNLFVSHQPPVLTLNDFRIRRRYCSIFLPNGEVIKLALWQQPLTIWKHHAANTGEIVNSEDGKPSPAATSEYPISLLYGTEFETITALVNAIKSLVDGDVRYKFDALNYIYDITPGVLPDGGECAVEKCMLWRDSNKTWRGCTTIVLPNRELLEYSANPSYSSQQSVPYEETFGGFATRQQALDHVNGWIAKQIGTHNDAIMLDQYGR